MTEFLHLTDEALLELVTARLSSDDKCSVDAHLASCQHCSERYAQMQFARSAFLRVAELGVKEVTQAPVPRAQAPAVAFPWKPVGAVIFGCLSVMVLLFYPRTVATASATELLSNAILYEDHDDDMKTFRVQVSGQRCATGQASEAMVSFDHSDRCGRALQHIQSTPWGRGNPLSAKTYATWRKTLRQRHDQVTKQKASWEIRTTTEEEPVQTASLELSVSDYHATRLTLDFADNEEVSIFEETEPSPVPLALTATTKTKAAELEHIDDPADLLEVQAWKTLHQLKADSGWEAAVLRHGAHVEVEAVVANDERKQQFINTFAPVHDIEVEVHLVADGFDSGEIVPDRARPTGNEPGLAEGWLEQQFPESSARTKFTNDALHLSQQVFGRAFFIDKLQQRQLAMKQCSCAKELADLVVVEKAGLSGFQGNLYRSLEPLIGSASHAYSRPLSLADAQRLDIAMEDLFSASAGQDESAFDVRIQKIRGLL